MESNFSSFLPPFLLGNSSSKEILFGNNNCCQHCFNQNSWLTVPRKKGPPINSLFDSLHPLESFKKLCNCECCEQSYHEKLLQKLTEVDSLWVTVFGFVPCSLTTVLLEMEKCGNILEKKIPSEGNWLHIKFHRQNEVSKALSLNGSCIDGNVMIGVKLFYPKEKQRCFVKKKRRCRRHFVVPRINDNAVVPIAKFPHNYRGLIAKIIGYVLGL